MPQSTVTTRILVAPRSGNFRKGETLTYRDHDGNQYSVEYFGKDGSGRSFVIKDEHITSVWTYQLRR